MKFPPMPEVQETKQKKKRNSKYEPKPPKREVKMNIPANAGTLKRDRVRERRGEMRDEGEFISMD